MPESDASQTHQRRRRFGARWSLSTQIFLGLGLGVALGLFFGEPMGPLKIVGDAFVKLLQMTVLPYVVVSIIAGLGQLDRAQARLLAIKGGSLLLILWGLAFLMVLVMPLAFPAVETASFFSTTLVEPRQPLDFIDLYIPSNPFRSLANNFVPAVVLFSIAMGIALISIEPKEHLVASLSTLSHALLRVNDFVVRLTPFGVFAIGASVAGTMTIEQFAQVQVFLLTYIAFALLMTFWLFPGLLATLTPIRFRRVLSLTRDAMVTAFATGSAFVVLPVLAERSHQLLEECGQERQESAALVNVILPVSHSFPHAAKVLTLSFVVFAGWFSGSALAPEQYPTLAVSGILSMFGSVNGAVPFLLDMLRVPQDMFQLFLATGILNARFGTLLATMHILILTLLGTCAITGILVVRWGRLVRYGVVTVLVIAGTILGVRLLFAWGLTTEYDKHDIIWQMHTVREKVQATVHRTRPPTPESIPGQSRLDLIRARGVLRVGYDSEDSLPFAFFNAQGELVGFDIEMAHSLARDLGVIIEFVPLKKGLSKKRLDAQALNSGYCDIIMSLSALSMAEAPLLSYSYPYLETTLAFVVLDHRRREFSRGDAVVNRTGLRIAVPDEEYYLTLFRSYLPNATLVPVKSIRSFFEMGSEGFDAMIYVAEIGSAWSLLYPTYTVVVPESYLTKIPLAYPLPRGEPDWKNVVDTWIELKKRDGTIEQLYNHWVLGREATARGRRWSVVHDVLHWFD